MTPIIQFYHLVTLPLEVALPSLVKKIWDGGLRLCITVETQQREVLSKALWQQGGAIFLPNCGAEDAQAALHPIVLSEQPTKVNEAEIVLITNGLEYQPSMPAFNKILTMFDGQNPEVLHHARALWKNYKEQGYGLVYFQQQEGGGWQKMHEVQGT
jgi:DNA polymerase-3 subunit chi